MAPSNALHSSRLFRFCSLIHAAHYFTFTSASSLKSAAHSSSMWGSCPAGPEARGGVTINTEGTEGQPVCISLEAGMMEWSRVKLKVQCFSHTNRGFASVRPAVETSCKMYKSVFVRPDDTKCQESKKTSNIIETIQRSKVNEFLHVDRLHNISKFQVSKRTEAPTSNIFTEFIFRPSLFTILHLLVEIYPKFAD